MHKARVIGPNNVVSLVACRRLAALTPPRLGVIIVFRGEDYPANWPVSGSERAPHLRTAPAQVTR